MPLGIENSGIEAGIIERGGAALSATIQRTGQAIQQSLLQQQAFRQARDLGAQISQLDPASDKWPQQAAFLTSQYPLATASGLAKPIIEPMAKAYAGFQQAKLATDRFGNSVALENLRSRHAMDRVEARPGATGAVPISFNSDPLQGDVTPGQQQGIQGVLAGSFGPVGALAEGATAQPTQDQNGVLPPLGAIPDGAAGLRDRSRREMMVMRDLSNENAASIRAGGPAVWNTRNQQTEIARRLKEEEKANAPAVDLVPSKTVEGVLVNPKTGTPFLPGENGGIVRPPGAMESARLQQTKENATAVQQRASASLQYRRAKDAEATAIQDFNREDKKLDRMKKDGWDSETDPNVEKYRQQLKIAMDAKEKAAKASQKVQSLGDETALEIITAPNGKKYEVNHATKQVIREVP